MGKVRINPAAVGALVQNDFENFLVASTPGGIEAQEARGQQAMVHSSTLPKQTLRCTREQLEKMGIVYGEDADDLFVNVELPEGWKLVPTDHHMWSKLVDEKGHERAGVFYKAAFYDRKAHISLESVYTVGTNYYDASGAINPREPSVAVSYSVKKHGESIVETEKLEYDVYIKDYKRGDALQKSCETWLNENFPLWQDPTAYWE